MSAPRRTPSLLSSTLTLVAKDLRLFARDRIGLMLGFLLPLALVAIFGYVMGNVGTGDGPMPRVEIWVVDLDRSEASAALLTALRASAMLDVEEDEGPTTPAASTGATPATSEQAPSTDEATVRAATRRRVSEGREPLALIIPTGFAQGRELELLHDPGRTMESQLVGIALLQALIAAQGPDLGWSLARRGLLNSGLPASYTDRVKRVTQTFRGSVEALFMEAGINGALHPAPQSPFTQDFGSLLQAMLPVQREAVAPEGRRARISYQVSHAVSGMTVMMLMFSLVGAARSLLEERDRGALRRLVAAPIDPRAILLSKFVGTFVLGLLLITLLFSFAGLAFDLELFSRLDTLIVLAVATAAACSAFAVLIAAWARTEKQADGVSTLLILVMAPLGGCWMPLMFLPEGVQAVSRFTLPYWSIVGFQGTFWNGLHWTHAAMWPSVAVLLGIAAGLASLALWIFRRRYLSG
ncbi:MAG: ABC transporter permease [Planctomycetota bacterium]